MQLVKLVLSCCLLLVCTIALAAEPPVKKSRSGICHPKGGTYYNRTKHYIPYDTMQACLDSGGRHPNVNQIRARVKTQTSHSI
ncbi:hypothetical protein [Aeromonas sp. 6P]|uniref:hypothetical protein n=1 Tax=Aeromonas sp. 6P TaxID=3452722 RepID=UPI003F7A1725